MQAISQDSVDFCLCVNEVIGSELVKACSSASPPVASQSHPTETRDGHKALHAGSSHNLFVQHHRCRSFPTPYTHTHTHTHTHKALLHSPAGMLCLFPPHYMIFQFWQELRLPFSASSSSYPVAGSAAGIRLASSSEWAVAGGGGEGKSVFLPGLEDPAMGREQAAHTSR